MLTGLEPATSTVTGWRSKPTELQHRKNAKAETTPFAEEPLIAVPEASLWTTYTPSRAALAVPVNNLSTSQASSPHDCLFLEGGVSFIMLNYSTGSVNPALRAVQGR